MINNVVLLGNLTDNPEEKSSKENKQFCTFTIALNSTIKGERTTMYIDCVAGGETGVGIKRYFRKGDYICVKGSLCLRSYKTKHGDYARKCYISVNGFSFCGSSLKSSGIEEQDDEPQVDLSLGEDDLPF